MKNAFLESVFFALRVAVIKHLLLQTFFFFKVPDGRLYN